MKQHMHRNHAVRHSSGTAGLGRYLEVKQCAGVPVLQHQKRAASTMQAHTVGDRHTQDDLQPQLHKTENKDKRKSKETLTNKFTLSS